MAGTWRKLTRRKVIPSDVMTTPLKRCLNTFDLTMIGVGHMIGAGVFILTGAIAREKAGPGVVLSYLVAGVAVSLAALCYAEFGGRVPKAGSAYTYTYVTMGELWAFVIGWDLILERLLGIAALAHGFSTAVDTMFGGAIRNGTLTYIGEMHYPGLSSYPDFTACLAILLVTAVSCIGVQFFANANNVFTSINLTGLIVIIGVCFWYGDLENWLSASLGGFLPYGFQGVIAGAATLFYTFVGFESITIGGEEATKPSIQIPIATVTAMVITTTVYVLAGASLTLMVPFNHIDPAAAFSAAFQDKGLQWAVILASCIAIIGITTSLFADMFSLPRVIYAMAEDGILFKCFSWVHPTTQIPMVSCIVAGIVAAIFSLLLDYMLLVSFLAIGTLSTFAMVSLAVLLQRYRPPEDLNHVITEPLSRPESLECTPCLVGQVETDQMATDQNKPDETNKSSFSPVLKREFHESPFFLNTPGEYVIAGSLVALVLFTVGLAFVLKHAEELEMMQDHPWYMSLAMIVTLFGIFTSLYFLSAYEETNVPKGFKVPFMPYVPALSIMANVLLLIQLDYLSWIRYAVWMLIGFAIYFGYGMHHSKENAQLNESTERVGYVSLDSTTDHTEITDIATSEYGYQSTGTNG